MKSTYILFYLPFLISSCQLSNEAKAQVTIPKSINIRYPASLPQYGQEGSLIFNTRIPKNGTFHLIETATSNDISGRKISLTTKQEFHKNNHLKTFTTCSSQSKGCNILQFSEDGKPIHQLFEFNVKITIWKYDDEQRVIRSLKISEGDTILSANYEYPTTEIQIKTSYSKGNVNHFLTSRFDAKGLFISNNSNSGNRTSYQYNDQQQITKISRFNAKRAATEITEFTYNGRHQLIRETFTVNGILKQDKSVTYKDETANGFVRKTDIEVSMNGKITEKISMTFDEKGNWVRFHSEVSGRTVNQERAITYR